MSSFKSFFDQQMFVEFAQQAFAGQPVKKSQSATKQEIMDIWRKIEPDTPIYITPMQDTSDLPGDHSTYGEDGIRITGSWPFIASVLGRIKDVLSLEGPQSKLRLVFRGVKSKVPTSRQEYAFYINLERRIPKLSTG